MAQVANKLWTLEEFLAFDDGTDTSYQLFEGRLVAMNPPLRGYGTLVGRLTRIIGSHFNRKLPDYQQIPSMRDIMLVSSMERLIRHWTQGAQGWTERRHRRGATLRLAGLSMSELYDGVLTG